MKARTRAIIEGALIVCLIVGFVAGMIWLGFQEGGPLK